MRYFLIDNLERLINRFTAVQYASGIVATLAIIACVSAFFYSWLAVVSVAAVVAVFFHIGFVCFLGQLIGLDSQSLGYDEERTRLLAFLSSAPSVLVWWLIGVALSSLFSVHLDVWILIVSGVAVYLWGLTFVIWAARKHYAHFDLVPRPLFNRW